MRRAAPLALLALTTLACGPGSRSQPVEASELADDPRVMALRARFGADAIPPGAVLGYEQLSGGRVHAVVAAPDAGLLAKAARVELPSAGDGEVLVEDARSHVAVRFARVGAAPVAIEHARGGLTFYGDAVHRVHPEGTEDYVALDEKPAREELDYRVDVRAVAGLRLVSNTLEFLDAKGAPRLRVSPPYVIDAAREKHGAELSVEGCAFDASAIAPWGRPVVAPGAPACTVRVRWSGARYPLLVDPAWVTTGVMATTRSNQQQLLLTTGKVLAVSESTIDSSAELFDEASGTWATTGSMSTGRRAATATMLPGGKVLVAGGSYAGMLSTSYLSSAELYDPASGKWTSLTMNSKRANHAAALLGNGKVLLTGGQTAGAIYTSSAELFDGTTFTFTTSLPTALVNHAMAPLASGKVLIAGGQTSLVNPAVANAYVSDGVTHTSIGNMAFARASLDLRPLPSGKVLVTGGNAAQSELFNGTNSFANVGAPLPYGYVDTSATLLSGKVLLRSESASNTFKFELFDGSTSFLAQPTPTTGSLSLMLTTLPSGKVLAAGSANSTSYASIFQVPAGDACTTGAQCASGVCDGGYCCQAACATCQACAAGTGACVTVANAQDADTCTGASTCSASGTCGLKNGQAATSGASCASGNAADGVCCDTACAGSCDGCAVAGKVGTCTITPGVAGTPSCAPFLCGATAKCPTSCGSDADCAAGSFCSATSVCTVKRAIGAACPTGNHECGNNQCVDGVCCSSPCTSNCMACSAAKSGVGGSDGTCTLVANGGVGRGECGSPSCIGSTLSTPVCNGAGSCTTGTKSCLPSSCNVGGNACQTSCTTDANCGTGFYCASSLCAAKKTPGTACTAANQCVSGNCVDGVCCSSLCGGPCEACNESGKAGTCTPVTGTPRTGHPVCNGAGTTCGGTCDGTNTAFCSYPNVGKLCNGGCTAGAVERCSASGTCLAPVPCLGNFACADPSTCLNTCATDGECASGFYCASGACKSTLGNGGLCSADDQCKSGHCVAGTCCAGACGAFACNPSGAACKTTCGTDADCNATSYCVGGACTTRKNDGDACGSAAECTSGFCADGVCCNSACSGNCEACTSSKTGIAGSTGTCNFVKDGTDPDLNCGTPTCSMGTVTANVCNGAGACRASTTSCGSFGCNATNDGCKVSCTADAECGATSYCDLAIKQCATKKARAATCAASVECASGACADGVCCDNACTGQCEACAEPGSEGTCMTVKGKPRMPRAGCTSAGTECGGSCDGKNAAVCSFPNLDTTCGAGCSGGSVAQCDGAGACRAPKACAGDFACDGSTACRTSCTNNAECRDGYTCDATTNKCIPKVTATCSADRSTSIPVDAPSSAHPCAPYLCGTDGSCLKNCATTDDCAAGATCDVSGGLGVCVPGATPTQDSGGCSVEQGGGAHGRGGAWYALFAMAAAVVARRRARARGRGDGVDSASR
jgi:hypothetical protein